MMVCVVRVHVLCRGMFVGVWGVLLCMCVESNVCVRHCVCVCMLEEVCMSLFVRQVV